ncbi:MAG TPA: VTT domain-containing protein [Gaiella sp.]|jgi:membrane protein DedA with SNARE-associated domain|nr:VTT domain-containing protein [Gaiella sp.]
MPLAALSEITDRITEVVGNHGLYAVFILMMIDAVFPAASELVMVYAGAIASGAIAGQSVSLFGHEFQSGFPAYVAMATAGTLGYLLGSIAGWGVGDYLGRPWLERHGRWLHLNAENLGRAERWFDRWEGWAVFLGRITPVMRSFISIPAGVFRARFGPYVWLTLLGSAIWCFAFAAAGWAAGANWESIDNGFHYVEYVIVGAVVVVLAGLGWRWIRRRRRPADEAARQDFPA